MSKSGFWIAFACWTICGIIAGGSFVLGDPRAPVWFVAMLVCVVWMRVERPRSPVSPEDRAE